MNKILEELEKYSIGKFGFCPNEKPLELPEYFHQWKQLRLDMTSLLINESLVDFVNTNLKVLECDSTNLPDKYLLSASVYISHIAHAYAYEIRRTTFNPKAVITFPESIEVPWQAITVRLGRVHPQITFYESFLWNVYGDGEQQRVFFNVFTSNTAEKFQRSFATVDKLLGTCAPHIYAINKKLLDYTLNHDELLNHLYNFIDPLLESTKLMRKMMNTSRFDTKAYVNPTLWAKTVANIGQSVREHEIGMSGGAAPSFRMLDIFLGRQKYDSELGKQLQQKSYTPKHTQFMRFIEANASKVIEFIAADEKCLKLFQQISQLYYGEWGYLGMHQKKVYGFMLVGLSAGRTDTNGGTLKTDQNTAVKGLDQEFSEARDERALPVKSSNYPLRLRVKSMEQLGADAKRITFDVKNQLFKIWPGDKLAVWPRNPLTQINEDYDEDLVLKDLNPKWQLFVEQHRLELKTCKDFLKTILTHGVQTVNAKHIQSFVQEFNVPMPTNEHSNVSHFIQTFSYVKHMKQFVKWLSNVVEPMEPRFYSICSSTKEFTDEASLSLAVGLLTYGQTKGTCSSFLHALNENDYVNVMPVYGYWFTPEKKTMPIIMIAGGTGLSPMISLIKNRIDEGCFENYLFFVTKNLENFYFRNELETFVKMKRLKLFAAFTRHSQLDDLVQKSQTNIVDLLNESRNLLNNLFAQDVYVYVCGRIEFAKKVSNTFERLLVDTIPKDKITEKLINMKHQGKYIEEAFTSHTQDSNTKNICITDVLSNDNYIMLNENVYDVTEFKKVHPGGDYVFLIASEQDYEQVHGKDPIARNLLNSLAIGKVSNLNHYDTIDLNELKKLKNLIGKYYCASDIAANDRTASMLVEHQSSFVKNFQDYFCDSHLESLRTISNHVQFSSSSDLIKVLTNRMPQDFVAFLWENVEKFNFKFLFSLRKYLISLIRSSQPVRFDIYQNPYEEFTKQIFGFKRVKPLTNRPSVNTMQKVAFERLNSQLSPIEQESDNDTETSNKANKEETTSLKNLKPNVVDIPRAESNLSLNQENKVSDAFQKLKLFFMRK